MPLESINSADFINLLRQGDVSDKVIKEPLLIKNIYVEGAVQITNCRFERSVTIRGSTFQANFLITDSEFVQSLTINGANSFLKEIIITDSNIAKLSLVC